MPAPRARRRPSLGPAPTDPRRGERGVSILLAMLVLFVLVVVIFQVKFDATVELDQARATVENARMARVADAAFQQARSALLMDIEQASGDQGGSGSDSTGDGGGGGSPFDMGSAGSPDEGSGDSHGDDSGGSGGDSSDESGDGSGKGTGADVSDVIARTDSKLDDWQDSVALQPPLGNDFTLWVEVVDEDSKLNLLGLWTPDATERANQHEIVRNLLDKAFEGTSLDLSWTDATEILDSLDKWVSGDRGSFDPVPKPKLKKSNAEDKAEEDGTLTPSTIDDTEMNYPLTLAELLDIEGLQPEHLHGFVEDDVFHPGLEEYLTVWSQLELKPKPPEADPFSGSPFTKGSLFDKPSAGSDTSGSGGSTPGTGDGSSGDGSGTDDGSGGDDSGADFKPTNDGLVNVNTAPLAVLRALAPDDIPTSFLERIVEFRDRIDELRKSGKLDNVGSLFNNTASGGTSGSSGSDSGDSGSDSGGKTGSLFGDEDDDDPTKYVFEKPEDVIPKVSEEFGITLNTDPDVQTQFAARLSVNSQVFTIKVLVLDQQTGRRTSYRGVVWRMEGGEKPVVLTLLPLEPYYDPRRLKDFPADIADKSQERFERWTDQGYMPPTH